MQTIYTASRRSKVLDEPLAACIVKDLRLIVGIGYNGPPSNCDDNNFPWEDKRSICHAEMNAIAYKTSVDVKGCVMYTLKFPCYECIKLIYQSGITKVIYAMDRDKGEVIRSTFLSLFKKNESEDEDVENDRDDETVQRKKRKVSPIIEFEHFNSDFGSIFYFGTDQPSEVEEDRVKRTEED